MKEIIFVTHNKGKIKSAEKCFKDYDKDLKISIYDYELDEPRSDSIEEIAGSKVSQAYNIVRKPCIALDAGFFIEELNGFPRAYVNYVLDTIGLEGILKLMEDKDNRKCASKECLAYYDGKNIEYFFGESKGNLAREISIIDSQEKWSDLWYIFKPNGFDKTLAEMTHEERINRRDIDKYTSAMENFAKWYIDKERKKEDFEDYER